MTTLYRFYSSTGELLYVGISKHLPRRLSEHSESKPWWSQVARVEVEHYGTRERAEAAETAAIKAEDPRYNIAGAVPVNLRPLPEDWYRLVELEPLMEDFVGFLRRVVQSERHGICSVTLWREGHALARLLRSIVGPSRIGDGHEWLTSDEAFAVAASVAYSIETPRCSHDPDRRCGLYSSSYVRPEHFEAFATPALRDQEREVRRLANLSGTRKARRALRGAA